MQFDLIEQIFNALRWLWSQSETQWLLAHIVLNVVAAVAASLWTGTFLLGRLWEFLYRKVLPVLLIWGAFSALGKAADLEAIAQTARVTLHAMLLADLMDNINKVLKHQRSRFQVPTFLTK